jgi:hypothetical protein
MILYIILAIGSTGLALFLWLVVATILRERRFARMPPLPAFQCPHCKSERIDVLYSGLWDGFDTEGNPVGGINEYGLCQACGRRCARDAGCTQDHEPYIPTEEEWDNYVVPSERARRDRENWPFVE